MIPIFTPTQDDITETVQTYGTSLYRLCFTMLGSAADAEDAVSDTILRYMTKAPCFHDPAHKKAWLLRTATNLCKDRLRWRKCHNHVDLSQLHQVAAQAPQRDILEAVLRLPEKYKTVIYLHYMEGYPTRELAALLGISEAAVRKRLQYARQKLKLEFEEDSI